MNKAKEFVLYACLPFVELSRELGIELGPVHFWPSSQFKTFIPPSLYDSFQAYIESMREIKTSPASNENILIPTKKLPLNVITCISINSEVPKEDHESLLIDSIYLLYFSTTFRNVYYAHEVPKFDVFTKILPASESFIKEESNWKNLHIPEAKREEVACINWIENEICQALGKSLENAYCFPKSPESNFSVQLVRAIRYFVDSFLKKFENLIGEGLHLSDSLFEPEDIVFLGSSFDALLKIDSSQPASDFRQKLRPMLHLKFSKPLELFWKWVDGFYKLKTELANGKTKIDPLFRINPNFEVSYTYIGIKLFIYTVYYKLFKYKLIPSRELDLFTPPDFKWIHPEELLLFFWTEESLLKKMVMLLIQLDYEKNVNENRADIQFLSKMYVNLFHRYLRQDLLFKCHLSPMEKIAPHFNSLANYTEKQSQYFDPQFLPIMKERLLLF